jgi:hypothetical protein
MPSLRRLAQPHKIQAFLNATPINHEPDGETVLSVREVIRQRRAHCIEGAMFAACALWVHGDPPLVMHLDCHESDYPHVIALFRRAGAWGRDLEDERRAAALPRPPSTARCASSPCRTSTSTRTAAAHKTLRSYSVAYDLRRIPVEEWVTNPKSCWTTHDLLTDLRHYPLITKRQERLLSRATVRAPGREAGRYPRADEVLAAFRAQRRTPRTDEERADQPLAHATARLPSAALIFAALHATKRFQSVA